MATYSSFKKINTEAIIDGAVTGSALATNGITNSNDLANASVRITDIQDGAVGTTQLASTIDLSGKTVTYRAIINNDIAAAAVSGAQLAAGAIATNIGYTPANKAGATFTSALRLPAGSSGTPSTASDGNTNSGIYFAGTDRVDITTAGGNLNNFIKSGSNIMHTQPNMPAFHASGNGGWYYGNSFGGVGRWTELNNLQSGGGWTWQIGAQKGGSNLAPSGRFTAPVAGWYSFYSQGYAYNDTNNSAAYTHWVVGLNGSNATDRTTGRSPHTLYGHATSANYIPGIMATLEIYMNAGDYTAPYAYMAPSFRCHGDHALWCGYLIG